MRGVLFGQNLVMTGGLGKELKVGQQFEVTAGTSKASIA
jgi:hypothetical protein